ncbi:hypothetical protein SAMD00023353_1800380 [Rosellinia necatrix]|uniref:Uncharacterized protein n=1 Tax=Rosellinia necatrix TaxID=77044 RepID=A0A1S8A7D0_ROSNE|nr:hypothetical protein SAMD00023353_1800380 [Rosellinia necatrix]
MHVRSRGKESKKEKTNALRQKRKKQNSKTAKPLRQTQQYQRICKSALSPNPLYRCVIMTHPIPHAGMEAALHHDLVAIVGIEQARLQANGRIRGKRMAERTNKRNGIEGRILIMTITSMFISSVSSSSSSSPSSLSTFSS